MEMLISDIVRQKQERFKFLVEAIANSKKRHDKILTALFTEFSKARGHCTGFEYLQVFLPRKLQEDEGIILGKRELEILTNSKNPVTRLQAQSLQQLLYDKGVYLVPVYAPDGSVALFIFHKIQVEAIKFAQLCKEIFAGTDSNDRNNILQTQVKLAQFIINKHPDDPNYKLEELVEAAELLIRDEIFYIGEKLVFDMAIDPRAISDAMEAKGFKVAVFQREQAEQEDNPDYEFFNKFLYMIISRTDRGLEIAHENREWLYNTLEKGE